MTDKDEQNEIDNDQGGKKQIIRLLSLSKKDYSFELIENNQEAQDQKDAINIYISLIL